MPGNVSKMRRIALSAHRARCLQLRCAAGALAVARGDPALPRQACPGGLLLFNLSNRYLDLDPVIGRQAGDAGLVCRVCYDLQVSDDEKRAGKQPSIWAVMAANETDLGPGVRPAMAVPCPAGGIRGMDRRLL